MLITPEQCRAGRALLGWSQDQLAKASKVAKVTIANFELSKREPYERTLSDLRRSLEEAGVTFLNDGELVSGGRGVRLRVAPIENRPSSAEEDEEE